ncbi:hypothetical protein ACFQ0B_52245 [Nonomuraea thailandensis]
MTPLFTGQGYTDDTSEGPFGEYLTVGMGPSPLVLIYEAQYVEAAARGQIKPGMVLMYPSPTVLSKHTLVPFTPRATASGACSAPTRSCSGSPPGTASARATPPASPRWPPSTAYASRPTSSTWSTSPPTTRWSTCSTASPRLTADPAGGAADVVGGGPSGLCSDVHACRAGAGRSPLPSSGHVAAGLGRPVDDLGQNP